MTDDEAESVPQSSPEAMLQALEPPHVAKEGVPYLGFILGLELYGLPLTRLREVARLTRLRRIPDAPPGVAGLVNLRGEIICALDTRAILGLPSWSPSDTAALVALRGFDYPVGLVVDSIADIFSIDPEQIEAPPDRWTAERAAYFVGTTSVRLGFMGLLDLDQVVNR